MILIVDDDDTIATSLEKFFRFAGLDAVSTTSALSALAMLHARTPRLILVDLHMPTLDGLAFIRAIRADRSFQDVPILVYSSDFSAEAEAETRNAGAQAYIVKGTMGLERLLQRVQTLIEEFRPPLRLAE